MRLSSSWLFPFYLALALVLVALGGHLVLGIVSPTPARSAPVSLVLTLESLLAAAALLYAAWQSTPGAVRRAWMIFGLAQSLYAIDHMSRLAAGPGGSAVWLLFYHLLFVLGVLSLPPSPRIPGERRRILFDLAIVFLAASLILGTLSLGPALQAQRGDFRRLAGALVSPACDLLLIWAVLLLLLQGSKRGRRPLVFMAASATGVILTRSVSTYDWLNPGAINGVLVDLGWAATYGMALLAGILQGLTTGRREPEDPADMDSPQQRGAIRPLYLPYAWLAAAYLLLVWSAHRDLVLSFPVLALGVGAAIILVLVRQMLAMNENVRLYRRLREAHAELEARVEQRTAQLAEANTSLTAEIGERRRAEDELRAQKQLFEKLVAVAHATSQWQTLEAALARVIEVAAQLTGADSGDLVLLDDAGQVKGCVTVHGQEAHVPRLEVIELVMRDGLAGWVARHRQAALLANTGDDPRWLDAPDMTRTAASALSVPISSGPLLVGVLTLIHEQANHFSDDDLILLQAAADQVALALLNARMFEEQRRLAGRQTVLYTVFRTVSGQLDPARVTALAVEAIVQHTGWRHVNIALPDAAQDHWRIGASSARLEHHALGMHSMSQGVIGRAFRTARTQQVRDVRADPDYISKNSAMRCEVAVPLRHAERVLGVLNVESDQPGAFAPEDVQLAELLADAVALALSNARLYQDAQRELAERTRVQDALCRHRDELQERNLELDAFAHTVAHDLKSPLSNVVGFARLLAQDYNSLSEDERLRCVQNIDSSGRKMNKIIEDLLLLATVRRTDVKAEPLHMGDIVAEAQQRLAYLIRERRAAVCVPDDWPCGLGYAPWVEEVWVNLMSNACKYGGDSPCLELGGQAMPGGQSRFWVRDYGDGVPPEQQAALFVPFAGAHHTAGSGHRLGLSIVRRIVDKLGGQVGVESQGASGQGSLFYFTLPSGEGGDAGKP